SRENEPRMVCLWETATGRIRHEIRLPRNRVRSTAFVNDRVLALGCSDGMIHFHDLARNDWLPSVHGHRDAVVSLAVSPDGRTLASGSWDTTALIGRAEALTGSRPMKEAPPPADLEALWRDLSEDDPVRAYRAVWQMSATSDAVKVLA